MLTNFPLLRSQMHSSCFVFKVTTWVSSGSRSTKVVKPQPNSCSDSIEEVPRLILTRQPLKEQRDVERVRVSVNGCKKGAFGVVKNKS
jgi:hypothetical protein